MINKKLMILAIFIISLLAVSAVSATDNNTSDIASTEENDELMNLEETDDLLNIDGSNNIKLNDFNSSSENSDSTYEILSTAESNNIQDYNTENDILSSSPPYSAYSVYVYDTTINYDEGGNIIIHVNPISGYSYAYDFYLRVYDSYNNQLISKNYYSSYSANTITHSINSQQLSPGTYTIKIVNYEDNHVMDTAVLKVLDSPPYSAYSVSVSDAIIPYESTGYINMHIYPSDYSYSRTYDFYLKVYDSNYNEKISYRYYGTSSSNTDRTYSLYSYQLSPGIYHIEIINTADYETMDMATLYVLDSSNMRLFADDCYVDEIVKIDYVIPTDATGNLKVYLNGNYVKTVSIGNPMELGYLTAGYYNVEVAYDGDDFYPSSSSTTSFYVYKLNPSYYSNYDNIIAGDNATINFKFNDDATGNVNISFGNWELDYEYNKVWTSKYNFTCQLINGQANITIPTIVGGLNEYIIEYEGNEKYESLWDDDYIYVNYIDSPITIDIPEAEWNDTIIFNPLLPNEATGSIELLLDNIPLATISIGNTYSYKAINGGKHYLTVKYSGDDYFAYNETTIEFYVNKLNTTFNIESTFDSERYITIPIRLTEDAAGQIIVNINNNIYSGKVINGTFNFTVYNLGAGFHNAIINYTGDSKYNSLYLAKEITVNLKESNINLTVSNILTGQNLQIKPIVTEDATGTVDIYVDDELIKTINVGSSYTLQRPAIGKHEIKAIYNGNYYFKSSEVKVVFRVFAIYPIEADDTKIVYGSDKKFQARFLDEYGEILSNKYISFTINGTTKTSKTNDDGIATLDLDLGIGEYIITSRNGFVDESKNNTLLIFNSIQAENMLVEYGSEDKFKATFLDENAKPLSNTDIIFIVDGEERIVTTDVNGQSTILDDFAMGAHEIVSINTLTDKNWTNYVVVVSHINSIMKMDIQDINYTQAAILKVNVGSSYLNATVDIKITGDNGYEKIFTQNASKTITKKLTDLNAGKYNAYVKYTYSDELFIIERNKTFNVAKIDPELNVTVENHYVHTDTIIIIDSSESNATVTIKLNSSRTYTENLVNGHLSKTIYSLPLGEYNLNVIFNGDNNYYPLIKSTKFLISTLWNFDVHFNTKVAVYDDYENENWIGVYNLADASGILTLYIDDEFVKTQKISDSYDTIYDEASEEYDYSTYISFNAVNLTEGIHSWKINYYDSDRYINSTQSGLFKAYHVGEPDKEFLVNKDGSITEIDGEFVFIKNGTIEDDYGEISYSIYSFNAGGTEYIAINWFPAAVFTTSCYKIFDPNEYKEYDGIYYKKINNASSEVIDNYETIDGVYYEEIGRNYDYYNNGYDKEYTVINGVCYNQRFYRMLDAQQGVDYQIINGTYYTLDGFEITKENYWPWAIVNEANYNVEGNFYFNHIPFSVGYDYYKLNNTYYRLITSKTLVEEDGYSYYEINNYYALINGKLFLIEDGDDITDDIPINKIDTALTASDVSVVYKDETGKIIATLTNNDTGKAIKGVKVVVDIDGVKYSNKTDSNGQITISTVKLVPKTYSAVISYGGNSKYNPTSAIINIAVSKADTCINAPDVSFMENDATGKLVATLTNANGVPLSANVIVNLNGVNYALKSNSDGQVNVSTADLAPGNYAATILYKGNSKYNPSNTTANVVINKKLDSVISAEDVTVIYGDANGKLLATLTNANGVPLSANVIVNLNGVKYTLKSNSEGQVSVSTADLAVGEYTATITYKGNSKYAPSSTTAKVIVNSKLESIISAEDVTVRYGDANGKLIATLTNTEGTPLSANIVVSLNGVKYTLKSNSKGQVSVSTADLEIGEYTATITYKGNSKYSPSTDTAKVTVTNKLVSMVSAEDVTVRCGDANGKLIATLTNAEDVPLSANIVISLNGENYSLKTNSNGQASVSTADLKVGEYTATIVYKGNSKYEKSSTTAKVTVVNKLTSVVSSEDVIVICGDANGKLIATLTNAEGTPLSANMIVTLNGVNYAQKSNSNGQISISTTDLAVGEYTATILYKGNSKYNPSNTTAKVTVKYKLDSVVSSEDIAVRCGDANGKLVATLTNAEGTPLSANIVISLHGVNYAMKTNSKGQASISTKDLAVGEYTATITYKGNSKYAPSSTTAKVIVNNKLVSVVTASDVTVKQGDANGKLIATLTNAEGVPLSANMVVSLNGVDYTLKSNSKGNVAVSTADLAPGEYTATITYKGNSKYNPSTTTAKVTVTDRLETCISGVYNTETKEVIGTLTNAEGVPLSANVVVSLNGVNYALKSNSKGQFKVSAADLAPGKYTAKLAYKGNSKYGPSSATVNVVIP